MSNPNGLLAELAKIGNYAIPAFGAFVTAALSVGTFHKVTILSQGIVVNFALYTMAAAFVAYTHRLCYLRNQHKTGKESSDLPLWAVSIIMLAHFCLVIALCWKLWPLT